MGDAVVLLLNELLNELLKEELKLGVALLNMVEVVSVDVWRDGVAPKLLIWLVRLDGSMLFVSEKGVGQTWDTSLPLRLISNMLLSSLYIT